MEQQKIIIIGSVASGSKCAFKLKRERPDFDIIIYTKEEYVSYSACGLPFYIGDEIKDISSLIIRTPEAYEKAGIKLFLKHELTKINAESKTVEIFDLEKNRTITDSYDKLVLATGARPFLPKIENSDLKNIFTLRTIPDGIKIKEQLKKSKNAVIIGGGCIGIELADAFIRNKIHVTMIEFANHIMTNFDNDIAEKIENHILDCHSNLIDIIKSDYVTKFIGEKGKLKSLITNRNKEINADMAIICTGVVPNTEYTKDTPITLGTKSSIRVDKQMQTTVKDIYAIGDCAEKTHIITNKPCWLPLGSTSNKEGRCCAINLAGGTEEFSGVLGSIVTKLRGFTMSSTGLTEREASLQGYKTISNTVTKNDKAGYMPEAKNITIKVIADKETGKLLGAQGIGCGDADKRINTVTSAILSGETVSDLANLDITYAPPFSPTIDPLLNVFMNLANQIKK